MRNRILATLAGALLVGSAPSSAQEPPPRGFIEIEAPTAWAPGARGLLLQTARSLRVTGRAVHPSGIERIVVNDVPFYLTQLADGSWRFDGYIPVMQGLDSVTVGAVARDGTTFQSRYGIELALPPADAAPPEQWASASAEFTGERWAIVIGISDYQHEGIPDLQYADRDAQEFASFLLSPMSGLGGFDQDKVLLLTNEDATYRRIRSALFTFLKNPTEDDVVFLFWAGHGTPDPDRLNDLYLLPHDADPGDIAASSILMEDLQDAIRRTAARDRIVITDACHSAGVGFEGTRAVGTVNQINSAFLERIARSSGGTVAITSSEASQISREGVQWGGGHGVFTYQLLDGLRGTADENGDRIVDVREMFEFVRERVKRETQGGQIPTISQSAFNPAWPMSVVLDEEMIAAAERGAAISDAPPAPAGRMIVDVLEGTWSVPDSMNAFVGVEEPVTIHLNGRAGPPVEGSLLSWASSNPAVARVSRTGIVMPGSPGMTTISASFYNEKRVEIALRVYDRPLQIEFTPRQDTVVLVRGDNLRMSASMELPSGEIVRGVLPTFSVLDTLIVAPVRGEDNRVVEGEFKGLREGRATISASLAGDTKTWTFVVNTPNLRIAGVPTLLLAGAEHDARALYARPDGSVLGEALGVAWESLDTAIVSIRLGGIIAQRPGRTRVIASAGTASDTVDVTVLGDLLVTTEREGRPRIHSLSVGSGELVTLLDDQWGGDEPALSPDGSNIAFTARREGDRASRVYLMNSDGTGIRRLVPEKSGRFGIRLGTYYEQGPSWSSDGRFLYFSSNRDGNYDIYRLPADGIAATPERIVSTGAVERDVNVAPDGPRIAFERVISQTDSDVIITLGDGSEELNLTEGRSSVNLTRRKPSESKPYILPGSLGILIVERETEGSAGEGLSRFDLSTRQRLAQIVRPQAGHEVLFAASRSGDRVAYHQRPRRGKADQKIVVSDINGMALQTISLPTADRILSLAWGAIAFTSDSGGRR